MNEVNVRTFNAMLGRTMDKVELVNVDDWRKYEGLRFESEDGHRFYFSGDLSYQSSVRVEEVYGDLADLIGSPILEAKEIIHDDPNGLFSVNNDGDTMWTFYRFSTVKGTVIVRFLGETTSPWYSITVDFCHTGPDGRTRS